MGVYIPNMEKPKNCCGCPCENDKNCQALDILKGECRENPTSSILTWSACPLIEIGDIQYKAFLEFNEKLMKKLEEHFLYGERRADE